MPVTVRGTDILFNDATTQSTAATLVPASYGAVGTVIIGLVQLPTINGIFAEGTTFAGSGIRRAPDTPNSNNQVDQLNWIAVFSESQSVNVIGAFWSAATTLSLSGTWRSLTRIKNANGNYLGGTLAAAVLLQRIS